MRHIACLLLLGAAACGDDALHTSGSDTGGGFSPQVPDAGVVDSGTAVDAGTPDSGTTQDAGIEDVGQADAGPADTGAEPDAGPPPAFQRFVAIGDVGEGNDKQHRVAEAIERVCGELGGCDFGLLLGDNHYDSGVDGDEDPLWRRHFELPYGGETHACPAVGGAEAAHELGFPFYAVLGNHDLGGDGLGLDLDIFKAEHQIGYGRRNPQWIMPSRFYAEDRAPVYLMGLNTTAMFFDQGDDQVAAIRGWLDDAPEGRWTIAFGHHPYISNGPHGNAGDYERIPELLQRITPNWTYFRGTYVQEFMEQEVCGKVDLYFAGHDHSRQDLGARCGTQWVVSGAGAKTTDLDDGDNDVPWESASVGFSLVEATAQRLVLRMYDAEGQLEHERIIER